MHLFPNEHNPPFQNIPAALQARHFEELVARLASEGVVITGETADGALNVDLSQLELRSGGLASGRENLYAALDSLNIAAVTVTPNDVIALLGRNGIAWGIARGLESAIPSLVSLLTTVYPDELFDRLEQASAYVMTDHTDTSDENGRWLAAQMQQAAESDLKAHGLLDGPVGDSYRDFLGPREEVIPEYPEEFKPSTTKQWVSPFSEDYYARIISRVD
jgi:hypothetical protein